MSEAVSLAQFWKDAPNADRHGREWLDGIRISSHDLIHGSGRIERCSVSSWWSGFQRVVQENVADRQPDRQSAPARPVQVPRDWERKPAQRIGNARSPKPLIFPFGNRYKGRLAVEVKEEDPGYWQWSITRADAASWWRPMVAKAGLLDDEDES